MVDFIKRETNDIFAIPILKTIFKNKVFIRTVQVITLMIFIYAIYYGFTYPTKENIFTRNVFWGLFWSLFMITTLVSFGRIFCGICPHGFIGKYISKIGLNLNMPKFLKNRYIGITILVVGWWAVYYTFPGVLRIPFATALMFTVLSILAIIFFFLYKDMSYCKYICPLGNLTKAYQKVSFTKLETYSEACKTCKTFECNSACSYNLKPFTFKKKNSMDDCTLCMDCANACESVNFKLITPTSTLYRKNKIDKSDIWVYLLIFASITFTMSLHHGLSRTSIADSFFWNKAGLYFHTITGIDYMDFSGLFAFLSSIIIVVSFSFIGIYFASKVLNEKFSTTLYTLGYSYAPLFIVASLGHLLHSFFTRTYANIVNGFIQGFNLNIPYVENLASRADSWLHIFHYLPYLAMILSAIILYKRIKLFDVSTLKKSIAFVFASSLIIGYLFLITYRAYVSEQYPASKTHKIHQNHKKAN